MPAGRVGVKQVELRSKDVSRFPTNGIEVEAEPRLPHDFARPRHDAESNINWGDDRDSAVNASRIRAHVRCAEIDAQLVFRAAHARRRGAPLCLGRCGERQCDCRQDHPAQELPHTKASSWGGKNRHIVKNHITFCQLVPGQNADGPPASTLTGHRVTSDLVMRLTPQTVSYLPKVSPTVIGRKVVEPPSVLTLVKRVPTTRRVLPVPILKATAAPAPNPILDVEVDVVLSFRL